MNMLNMSYSAITGEPGARPFTYTIDGETYESMFTDNDVRAFQASMEKWASYGVPTKNRANTKNHVQLTADERSYIRGWAELNGVEFAEKGRLPRKLVDQFVEAVTEALWNPDTAPEMERRGWAPLARRLHDQLSKKES